jgi:CubicO group peptidase (beta-lactamase class C family)/TolB-like protein
MEMKSDFRHMLRQIIVILILLHGTIGAQEYVAIMELEGSGMSKIEARNVTERFSYELSQTRKFNIIERQQLDLILDEQKTQLSGCVADECAVQIGELVGAKYVIAGSVTKTFGLYGIAVRLIDVESGEIITHILESDEADVQKFVSQRVRNAALRMAAEGGSTNGQSGGSVVTVSSEEKGSVVFTINKSGAAVYVDNAYTTQASSQTVSLNLTEGTHQIKFTLPGQQDWIKQLNVLAGETLNYEVTFESGTGSGGVAIDYGIVMVRSEPTGAIAYLDGVELGPTPAQNTKVGVGKHLIRVEKPLYHPYVEEITITSDGIEQIQANLKPRFGRLVIKSVPPGAVVQLNGQQKGKTPIDLPELASGDYTITVSKDLHHDSVEKYTITDGSDNERTVVLHPAFGQLSVEVNPNGADVFVDGQFKGKAPITLDELPSGAFRLKVSQALYETLDEEITIEDGKTNKQVVVLSPRFGTLNITGSPTSAQVSINGKTVGNLPLVNHKVGTGLAEIKISAKDYHEHEQFIQVDINEMYPVNVDLVRHSGTIVAISDPPEALLRLDGKEVGPSPQILKRVPTGKHSLVFAHPSFLEEVREFNLGLDERMEFNIKLVTYEGSIQQDIDRLAWYRNLSLVGSGGFALGALALKISSNNTYDDYKAASNSDQAAELFDEAESLNQISSISIGIAAMALLPALYYQFDIAKNGSKLTQPISSNTLGSTSYQVDDIPSFGVHSSQSRVFAQLNDALAERAWPGGVLVAYRNNVLLEQVSFGTHTYSRQIRTKIDDIFDLSSISKVIGTTSAIMLLYEDGKLDLDSHVYELLPRFINANSNKLKSDITVAQLLSHTSGLPPFKRFYLMDAPNVDALWDSVFACNPETVPGQKYAYSDIGSLILGQIVERIGGDPLDVFMDEHIFTPLGMTNTGFQPKGRYDKDRIMPTEYEMDGNLLHGVALDENCQAFGGITGHSGLFSTAADLSIFCQMMLNQGSLGDTQIFKPETVELFTSRANIVTNSSRCLGWDSPASTSSGGVYLSSNSFGHTGFTGTSLWIDPENQMFVILLTNAVHPNRSDKYPNYFDWRQYLHSSVYESEGITLRNEDLEWRERWLMKLSLSGGGFLDKWKYERYVKKHRGR